MSNKPDYVKLLEMLKYNFNMGGIYRAETEQMLIYLIGRKYADELISQWAEEMEEEAKQEQSDQ